MLPAATSLKKQGANKGATTAFLISTPESGVDSIAVTYALLDPFMTVIRPIAAFTTAMVGGITENLFSFKEENKIAQPLPIFGASPSTKDQDSCCAPQQDQPNGLLTKMRQGVRFALVDVWADIAGWFFVGVLVAGLITALIPQQFMESYLGGGLLSMLLMLSFGIPLYICATASTPIAAALILKGVSPGAALVFLLVGPATNVASLSVLLGILGKKSTMRYLMTVATLAVLFGLLTDKIYTYFEISPQAIIGHAGKILPHSVELGCALLLLVLSYKPLLKIAKKRFAKLCR